MKLKLLILLLLTCAGFFAAWRHHQHSLLVKFRDGGIRVLEPSAAEKMQHYVDR
jgi:hypothetical protein